MSAIVDTEDNVEKVNTKVLEVLQNPSQNAGLVTEEEREENMKTAVVHADITDKIGDMSIKTKEKINKDMQRFLIKYISQINTFAAISYETYGKGALFIISKCTFTDLCSEKAKSHDRMFLMVWGPEKKQDNHNFVADELSYFFKEYCTTLPGFISQMTKESNRFPIVICCSPTGTRIHPVIRNFARMPKGYGKSVEKHRYDMVKKDDIQDTKYKNGFWCDGCLTKLQKNFYMCELVDFAYCANCYKLSQRPFHEQYGLNEKGRAIEYSSVGQVAFIDYKAMLEAGRNMYFDKTVNAPLEIVAVNIDRDESQPLS